LDAVGEVAGLDVAFGVWPVGSHEDAVDADEFGEADDDEAVDFRERDLDRLIDRYWPDAVSIPANHGCLWGHDDIRAWYSKRTGGDYEMNVIARCDRVDIAGDIAVAVGIFRVTRSPQEGVAGLDHAGRYLNVMRRIDGEWRM